MRYVLERSISDNNIHFEQGLVQTKDNKSTI